MAKMTDSEVRATLAARLSDTLGSTDSELRKDRELSMDFYYGRPMGNEIEGRSQIVSKVLMDTVEWAMPSFLRIFANRDAIAFDPVGPEDEEQAKQETGYVSHVFWKKNTGFMITYCWIKDALLQKVGYVRRRWVDEEKVRFKSFTGLTDDQLVMVMEECQSYGEVEIVGSEQENGFWNIKLKVKHKSGSEQVDCYPPEDVVVDSKCRGDVRQARFIAHLRSDLTRSDLIEMGYDREKVKNLTDYTWQRGFSEEQARDSVNETLSREDQEANLASQTIRLLDVETYLDEDDDGIAELRRYFMAGNETLENDEIPEITWESLTALPVPHRHAGLSLYDLVEDRQRVATALERGLLDNTYFSNNRRVSYNKNTVSLADLQINRPGGHVAVDGPPVGQTQPIEYTPIAGQLLPVIEYNEQVIERRTGVGRHSMGADADVLANSTKGAYMDAVRTANQRIESMARIMAETGFASLLGGIHRDLRRNQDWPTKFKLRNEWAETNPAEWDERTDLTVSIGLGNASKEEVRANLGLMAQAQEKAGVVAGLIQPQNVFALFRRMQSELGFENEPFITDPESPEFKQFMQSQQGKTDPYIEGEQIKAQTKLKEADIESRDKTLDRAQKRDLTITELEVKSGVDLAKAGIGAEVAVAGGANAARGNSGAASGEFGPAGGIPGG